MAFIVVVFSDICVHLMKLIATEHTESTEYFPLCVFCALCGYRLFIIYIEYLIRIGVSMLLGYFQFLINLWSD